jgi:hypothetical protein
VEAEDAVASVATGAEPPKIVSNTESTTLEDDGLGAAFGAAAALEPCARDAVAAGVAVAAAVWEGTLPLRLAASTAASTIEDVRTGADAAVLDGCLDVAVEGGGRAVVTTGPTGAACAVVDAIRVGVRTLVSTAAG